MIKDKICHVNEVYKKKEVKEAVRGKKLASGVKWLRRLVQALRGVGRIFWLL